MEYSKILTSNFQGNEVNVMRTFNCDPAWPICLYDFTYKGKSNEFSTMRCKKHLGQYVVDDYFTPKGVDKTKESRMKDDPTDVVRESNPHLC